MTDRIRFIEIEINNYRQYFEEQTISFQDRKNGFDVILGNNGAGKSNILNAVNWCFYNREPHMDESEGKSIVNDNYFEQIDLENQGKISVKIKLKIDDDEYHVSRILSFVKHELQYEQTEEGPVLKIGSVEGYNLPIGTEVDGSSFEIMKKPKGFKQFKPLEGTNFLSLMNNILPLSLSSYFLLDGEYLENFWKDISKVQIGVESISQLNSLSKTSEHLRNLESSVPTIGDKQFDEITAKIKRFERYENSIGPDGKYDKTDEPRFGGDSTIEEYYSGSGFPRIKELKEDKIKIKNELEEITHKLRSSNIENVKKIETQIDDASKELTNLNSKVEKAKKDFIESQISNGPYFLLVNSLKTTNSLVDHLRTKGQLPYEAKKLFTQDLLDLGTCICGNNLKSKIVKKEETNKSRGKVERIRDDMTKDQGLDYALKMHANFNEKILRDESNFITTSFDDLEGNYVKLKREHEGDYENLQALKRERQLYAADDDDIKKILQNHEYLIELTEKYGNEIRDIERRIDLNRGQVADLKKSRNTLKNRNERSLRIAHEQNNLSKIVDIIDKTLTSLKKEIRLEVQKKTFESFKSIMYKEMEGTSQLKTFAIRDDYSVMLTDERDSPALGTLSKGEKLFLALSFISALKETTGYKFPLIIDTPLGRVSGISRVLLSKALPYFLPDEQVIFLATSSEFCDRVTNFDENEQFASEDEIAFGELLERNVPVNYFRIDPKPEGTKVIDFIPIWRTKK
jgi:DNA sulfur modification protein DndD